METAKKSELAKTNETAKPPRPPVVNLFPSPAQCSYFPCYCEENVWKLCQDVSHRHPSELSKCSVVFVSNERRTVLLWRQRAGKDEEKLVIWDYHVLFLYHPDDRCLVYDLGSELPFPTYFHKYVTETFRTDQILKPDYFRYFRVVPAPVYFQNLATDRRHMKRSDGTWIKPPPDYNCIQTPSCCHNLEDFISVDPSKGFGVSEHFEPRAACLTDKKFKRPGPCGYGQFKKKEGKTINERAKNARKGKGKKHEAQITVESSGVNFIARESGTQTPFQRGFNDRKSLETANPDRGIL